MLPSLAAVALGKLLDGVLRVLDEALAGVRAGVLVRVLAGVLAGVLGHDGSGMVLLVALKVKPKVVVRARALRSVSYCEHRAHECAYPAPRCRIRWRS